MRGERDIVGRGHERGKGTVGRGHERGKGHRREGT